MKILITGDLFITDPQSISIETNLMRLMRECDYRIVNLEGPLVCNNTNEEPPKSGPRLKQSVGVIKLLDSLDVNMLTLANNHLMDYGNDGFLQTKTLLSDHYLLIGCGTWDEAYRMEIIESDGLRVGVLNFCEMQFGMLYDEWTQGDNEVGCAWINHRRVNSLIAQSKKQVDYLIVISHAGLEMIDIPLPEWRDRYREIIDCGADALIAHHPHVVQGFEYYRGKPICYSLGNFCFSGGVKESDKNWNVGAIALLDCQKEGISFTNLGCCLKDGSLSLLNPVEWKIKMDKLCNKLKGDCYMKLVNYYCSVLLEDYMQLFAMGGLFAPQSLSVKNIARVFLHKYNYVHLLNNLQCESHRWCISRALINHKE